MSQQSVHTHQTDTSPNDRVDDLSTVQLIERLTDQVGTLVRTEVDAGLAEVKNKGSRLGVGIGISSAGALLLFFGTATLIATAVLGLATVLDPWLAALIVAVAVLVVGGVLAALGASRAKNALPPVPENTAASVEKDIEAVKKGMQ
ncbi:phage holin family protein [Rhodococcus sovatensis]|uniref:Phage holin family protein n=1 Tax=Rhodococcus sovatensis TaxID=1805840 RepID=A0ABZ2PJS9_9NOCA